MKGRWLHKADRAEAVVVFGGWAVGAAPFLDLAADRDVYFLDDYRDLDADLPDLSCYDSVDLVAWSFGVAAYGHWQVGRHDPFARKAALCGSLAPVSRRCGIPPLAYRRTVEGLSQASFQQFQERVFGVRQPETGIVVDDLRAELIAVENRGDAPMVTFDRVWVAERDLIFPLQNMLRAWAEQDPKVLDAPHAPFAHFPDWEAFWA